MNKLVRRVLPVPMVLGVLLVGACGSETGASSSSPPFNDADVAFAQGMIPHHQQAIDMAQHAEDRARSPQVKELAAQIEAAQAPEIERMTTWLEEWDAEVPSGQMGHGDMGHGDDDSHMSGMMTAEDMAALSKADGDGFDRMFLQMMIEHHEGAITMAETEVADGENPDAMSMAEEIITTQSDEIDQMKSLLDP